MTPMPNPSCAVADKADVPPVETFWERAAATRWGQYISDLERRAIMGAASAAKMPAGTECTAIEIGCEGGRWSQLLTTCGWSMLCTDIQADVLRICQSRLPSAKCILTSSSATSIPADSASAQLLLCIEVPTVIQSDWFVDEALRVLQTGGYLVTVVWNRRSARGMLAHLRSKLVKRFDYYSMSYPRLRATLMMRGFQIMQETGLCWFPLSRNSNSWTVPLFAAAERWLGLGRLPSLSPWVIVVAKKSDSAKRDDHP